MVEVCLFENMSYLRSGLCGVAIINYKNILLTIDNIQLSNDRLKPLI